MGALRSVGAGEEVDGVGGQAAVGGHERELLARGLGDQHAVEAIAVVGRQAGDGEAVVTGKRMHGRAA